MDIVYHIMAILGGAGVLIIGLSKFLGEILKDRIKERERRRTEQELELGRHRLGLRRVQADRFAASQYEVYVQLWQALQGLRLAVDALWDKATRDNIGFLAQELKDVKSKVQKWSLFFEDHHYNELVGLIEHLQQFEAGKVRLVEIRSRADLRDVYPQAIELQIEQNRTYKDRFEVLLEQLRSSFRERLSGIHQENAA